MKKLIFIIGSGPGIATGVAHKFGTEGFEVVLFARNEQKLQVAVSTMAQAGVTAYYYAVDAGDTDALRIALLKAVAEKGAPNVLHYNVAAMKAVNILDETADSLAQDFRLSVGNLLTAVKALKDGMKTHSDACVLITGGGFAMYPSPDFGSLSIGKAGVKNLGNSLFRVLKAEGIHVGTVTVCGLVNPEDAKYNPDAIATNFWNSYQARDSYEIVY